MNTVTDRKLLDITPDPTEGELELIPIGALVPSATKVQTLRRSHYSAEKLLELSASIQANGVLQPILVRPHVDDGVLRGPGGIVPKYEIVAGERRWIAADRAGLGHLPAFVRELTDAQTLQAQLVENLEREDLDVLEEATGFRELIDVEGINAETVGERTGKSRSYVYARLKLLDLIPSAREALQAGAIDASKALLIARFKSEKLQAKALEAARETSYGGDPVSYRRLFADVRASCMVPLAAAPFALDDATLTRSEKVEGGKRGEKRAVALPACFECPHFSGNDAEIRAGLPADAHVCMDPDCHAAKLAAVAERRRAEAEAAGQPVLAGDAAKKIAPRKDKLVGFVDLDESCDWDQYPEDEPEPAEGEDEESAAFVGRWSEWENREHAWKGRSYRQLLGEHDLPITRIEDPKTKRIRELVPVEAARKLLKQGAQILLPGGLGKPDPKPAARREPTDWKAEQRKREEREAKERAWRVKVFEAIAAKAAGPMKREDLVEVADHLLETIVDKFVFDEALKGIYDKRPEPGDLKDAELGALIRLLLIAEEVARTYGAPRALLAAAKRYKINVDKIKQELKATERAAAKAAKAAKPAEEKAPAKKGGKKK